MTDARVTDALGVTYEDFQTVGDVVALRLLPGFGEADRVARVRKLLDVCADLNYAVSTYTHRVLMYSGRRPGNGDLRDDTAALHDALGAFAREVRTIADTYRSAVSGTDPANQRPQSTVLTGEIEPD
jgi:hypothetical protein